MDGRTRTIAISGASILLAPNYPLNWANTNLPSDTFFVKPHAKFYWDVYLVDYDKKLQCIRLDVLDYRSTNMLAFNKQRIRRQIQHIVFSPLDWQQLEQQLSGYQFEKLIPFLAAESLADPEVDAVSLVSATKEGTSPLFESLLHQRKTTDTLTVEVPFSKLDFGYQQVSFSYDLSYSSTPIQVTIKHSLLFPELNYIKNYLEKVFSKKTIQVEMVVHFEEGMVSDIEAKSKEIAGIDSDTLVMMHAIRLDHIRSFEPTNEKRILLTSSEFLSSINQSDSSRSQWTANELIKWWIESREIRNGKQLAFLSGHLQSKEDPIRMTVAPNFGFVFTIQTPKMIHYCWELLDSNATYLWSFDKELHRAPRALSTLGYILSVIKTKGRKYYRHSFPDGANDYLFHAIRHKDASSLSQDNFTWWKHRLTEKLI